MAGCAADLLDPEQNRIGIAIDVDFLYFLHVAALLSLAPEPASAAAIVTSPPRTQRLFICFPTHPGQHQHLAGFGVLSNSRHQAACFVEINHCRSSVVHSP